METSSVLDYFFFPSLREISSKIFGRRSASMLSTMLAMAGSDAASLTTRAERHGDGWVLNGEKHWITNGNVADLAIAAAEHVVGNSLDATTSRRLVNEFVAQSRDLQC